jgi:putative ABC transport system substrate-binding protein
MTPPRPLAAGTVAFVRTSTRAAVRLVLTLGVLAVPVASAAQPAGKIARIGFLGAEKPGDDSRRLAGLRAGLRDLGYVEGTNIVIEGRWAEGNYDRVPDLAAELIRLKADVLVVAGTKALLGARRATTTVPIVVTSSGDIVALGLVASLARPGGNITGSTNLAAEISPKRLEFLKETAPRIVRTAYLVNPANPGFGPNLQALWARAKSLQLELQPFEVRGPNDLDGAFTEMTQRRMEAVVLQDDTLLLANLRAIVELVTRYRLPAAGSVTFAEAGGLIGYQQDLGQLDRRAAIFVDKILKGAKPADLPIEQPTKFHLAVNLKTAKALGLTIPPSLLARADQVIQ